MRSEGHQKALSESLKKGFAEGRSANKGKLGKKDSPETREKKRLAALARKPHSQETKDKIGDAHRGKTQPPEAIERQKITMAKRIEENGGGFATGPRSQEVKDKMSQIAQARSEEEWRPKVEAMWKACRGIRLTPEQCEKH